MSGIPQNSGNYRRRKFIDKLMTVLAYACAVIAFIPLAAITFEVARRGLPAWDLQFFTDLPSTYGDGGGVRNAIIGSAIIVGGAGVIAIPIGILSGIYLAEYGDNRLGSVLRFVSDVMTGAPSVVIGILAYSVFVVATGDTAAIYGSVALAILVLPVIIRATEGIVRLVPGDLREASLALGIPRWKTILRVVVPTALSGIVTGIILAMARASGETAPLLFAIGTSNFMNLNPLEGPMAALPVIVYQQSAYGGEVLQNAWGGALLLFVIIVALNLTARLVFRGRSVR
ncbi:MAG: phosphate ABC transporter permease PstA [Rubrobacteraceae bacterium]